MRSGWMARLFLVPVLAILAAGGCSRDEGDFVELMNEGKAHLENRDALKAVEALEKAAKARPESPPALRNLARAYRLVKQPDRALEQLNRALKLDPDAVSTIYLKALTLASLSRPQEALPLFEQAVRLDPQTAALRFQLANAYDVAGEPAKAAQQLRETARLDPLHATAHFKLATYARRAKDTEEFEYRTRVFMQLRERFGDETRSGEALETCKHTLPEPPPLPTPPERFRQLQASAIDVRFQDVTDVVVVSPDDAGVDSAAVIDVDGTGRTTIFAAGSDGTVSLLRFRPDAPMERERLELKLPDKLKFPICRVGDFHDDVPDGVKYDPANHALQDVFLCGPGESRLLKRTGLDSVLDVTESAGLDSSSAIAARWVDYEHDGDLDLLLLHPSRLALWQNNGNGQFEEVTTKVGLQMDGAAVDVVAVDLEADVATDLIVARGSQPTLVYENQRVGTFALMPDPPGPWPPAKRVLADDVNNDGYPDAVLITDDQAVVIAGHGAGRLTIDFAPTNVAAAVLVDYDNDGWLDLCVAGAKAGASGEGQILLFRNVGSEWTDTTSRTQLTSITTPPIEGLLAADLDADGDTDLLATTSDGRMRILRNEGGNTNGQMKIRLTSVKTNPSAFGTHIEVRAHDFWVTRQVTDRAIEIGLADWTNFESIQTIWTNGVVDNQVNVKWAGAPIDITEKVVPTGSCPFLYAWDGTGYRFVTDLLGNSPVGLPQRRGVMLPADPDEIVTIGPAEQLPPQDGHFDLVVTDEFREILYLDEAKLLAVDHPADVEVHPTDKMMPPPFPTSEVWALGRPRSPRSAMGDDGIDRTAAVREVDGRFAPPGVPLPSPYRGMCHPMVLTLDFGDLDPQRPHVLALTGWLQYGDASTNIAMGQNPDLTIIPPKLDAQVADGTWRSVDVVVGMPAGKTKTILCDLTGRLPRGARRLRLSTTFEIRWDRIALLERSPLGVRSENDGPQGQRVRFHEISPSSARLGWRGFSEIKSRAPGHPRTPRFDAVSERPPWRTALEGWHTRYGDVLPLLAHRDDQLVVVGAGDALNLRFPADSLPPLDEGQVRTFFFYSVGWDKDGDHNVTTGDTVEPLPGGAGFPDDVKASLKQQEWSTPAPSDWRIRYNTRWVSRDQFRPGR